jgi:hypothetical protein
MSDYQTKREQLLKQSQGVIFPYSDRWVSGHQAFAAKMWPDKIRRRDEAYNRWKFKGPQKGNVDGLLLAVVDGRVVGQLGLIPDRLWVDSQVYRAQWACDLMVDTNARKRGLGSMLFAVAMNRGLVTLGSEPSPLADITMSRIGFKPLVGPHKMVLPLDVRGVMGWVFKDRLKPLTALLSKGIQPINDLKIKRLSKRSVKGIRLADWQDVASLVARYQATIKQPHILHDESYLAWRYSVPFEVDITTMISTQGSYAICEATSEDYYVYDWHAAHHQEAFLIFTSILQNAQQSGCKHILAYANHEKERKQLIQCGFFQMRTPIKVIFHNSEPILNQSDAFHYCIYDSDGNL